jgi:hypothetical protein
MKLSLVIAVFLFPRALETGCTDPFRVRIKPQFRKSSSSSSSSAAASAKGIDFIISQAVPEPGQTISYQLKFAPSII